MFGDDSPCPSDSQPVFFKHAPDAGFASVRLGCWETPPKKKTWPKNVSFSEKYLFISTYIILYYNAKKYPNISLFPLVANIFPASPWFAHTQTTYPNNVIYLSPEDE
jgi:hypothetical protein